MLFIEMENAWVHALKGKRRKCSAFEMMFKKNLMETKKAEERRAKSIFKLSDFRKDDQSADNTVVDIAAYRFARFSLILIWEIKQLSNLHIFMIGRKEFTRFDQNGDGEIDIDEFGKFLRSICLYLTSFFPVPW